MSSLSFLCTYSHSTMYLLKLKHKEYNRCPFLFTFHHVSIKTNVINSRLHPIPDSHSTMYLLKRSSKIFANVFGNTFTFHHVSIKTKVRLLTMKKRLTNSHSTMYLLKQIQYLSKLHDDLDSHSTMYLLKH